MVPQASYLGLRGGEMTLFCGPTSWQNKNYFNSFRTPLRAEDHTPGTLSARSSSEIRFPNRFQSTVRNPTPQKPKSFVQASGTEYVFAFPNSHIYFDDQDDYTQNITLTITNTKNDVEAFVRSVFPFFFCAELQLSRRGIDLFPFSLD